MFIRLDRTTINLDLVTFFTEEHPRNKDRTAIFLDLTTPFFLENKERRYGMRGCPPECPGDISIFLTFGSGTVRKILLDFRRFS